VLSLCAAPALSLATGERLRVALAGVRDWDALVTDAEHHGVETLLLAHAHAHGGRLPPPVETRLKVRFMQQAHAAAVRAGVIAAVLDAFDADGISALLLKGAALAHLVYPTPVLRPMRDVDVLVAERDADRAWRSLHRAGFAPVGLHPGRRHHHLHSLGVTVDGETIAVEIHRQLLAAAPFVRPLRYEDISPRAQTFSCGARPARTLGREDMLWHIYAHAFLVTVIRPETRLIWIADLVSAMEAWADAIDWDRLRRTYPRLVRALPLVGDLVPWSPRVQRRLDRPRRHVSTRPGRAAWWFDVHYGNDGPPRRFWNRLVTHPVGVALTAAQMARVKLDLTLHRRN
jgi:hypothetical protein